MIHPALPPLTALDGETLIDYLSGMWTAPAPDRFTPVRILNITDVGVTDSHRSSGIGLQLMQVAEEIALK
ncbi:GNAT family N-acetyltransferase [Exiguobacterium sp. TDN 0502]|uniref:GNAT family N-acetyltransferase n=1 Tax=Exiguobacterium sp. TDN 0502 TaxID=3420731 RepID=UPI003D7891DD